MKSSGKWRPTATLSRLKLRARLSHDIREFFTQRQVLEIETPTLSTAGNTDPQIQSLRTDNHGYLRTSPEFSLKRLLASGSGDIYELGRVFRAGESGRFHNPEFTLLEWYRTAYSYHQLMEEVVELIRHCGHGKFDRWPVQKFSYRALFLHYLEIDPLCATADELSARARQGGIEVIDLEHTQWLDLLLSHLIQPVLPAKGMTLVYDYPADQSALAKIRADSPPVAERFELYLGAIELANGYQELTDANEQQQRFEQENRIRQQHGDPCYTIDQNLIQALHHGMPECAGVALGVDRLAMAISDAESLQEVIAFPYSCA